MREAIFSDSFNRFLAALSLAERQEVENVVHHLEENSELDGDTKVTFFVLPRPLRLFLHPRFWIIYDVPDTATVEVWAAGPAGDQPPRLR